MVETASVKTLQGFLTTRDRIELDVNVAFGIRVNGNVNDFAVLLIALDSDLRLQVLDPAIPPVLLLSVFVLAGIVWMR